MDVIAKSRPTRMNESSSGIGRICGRFRTLFRLKGKLSTGKPAFRKQRQEFVNARDQDENPALKIDFLLHWPFPYRKTIDGKNSRDERQDYIRMTDSASQSGKIIYQTVECYRIE
ncbi:MAG: hypothetical protein LBB62_09980 [Proteiniphilum sp.]|jgi:hypothetical protein|nr:hypothetical protein [Proteiniphilum sp.]